MKARLTIIALLLAMAPPAHAGWRAAQWGMTVEQVVAAMPGEAKAKRSGRDNLGEDKVGASGAYVWETDEFETLYYFRNGGLTKVAMEWKKKPKPADCQRLLERIAATHGNPLRTSDQTIIKLAIWHDKPTETRIRALIGSGICTVYYERLSDFEAVDLANTGHQIEPPKVTGGTTSSPVEVIPN